MKHAFSIGHSNRLFNVFVELLNANNIELLIDIRGGDAPGSKTFPHFNKAYFIEKLPLYDVQYLHLKDLGGRRGKQQIDESLNDIWTNPAFRNYADWAHSEPFQQALDKLCYYAEQCKVAYMCSEAVPWRCHRQIVTDYMILEKQFEITHIVGKNQTIKAQPNKFARKRDDKIIYPTVDPDLFV